MTYKEVYDITMPPAKRADEKYLYWDRLLRIPATLLTIPFICWHTKPTTITKWSIVAIIISFALIAFGPSLLYRLVGWGFLFFWGVLDSVDGQLARCTNQCSNMGDFWDTMGGYLAMIFIYFSAAIAAFYGECAFPFFESYISLMLGGATAVLAIFPRLMMQKKKNYGDSEAVKKIIDKPSFSWSKVLMQNIISPTAFLQPIFLLAIIFHLLDWFILFYFIMNLAVTAVTLRTLLKE